MSTSQSDGRQDETLDFLLSNRRTVRSYSDEPIGSRALHRILAAAQGITSPDGKRAAPSAHALYPLQLFVVVRRVGGVERGVYVYEAGDRSLSKAGEDLAPGTLLAASLANDTWLEEAAAIVVIGARIERALAHFAEQQPDGKRGARYVDFEAGACTQNMYLAATAERLGGVVVMGFDDERMNAALALPSGIVPISLFCIGHPQAPL